MSYKTIIIHPCGYNRCSNFSSEFGYFYTNLCWHCINHIKKGLSLDWQKANTTHLDGQDYQHKEAGEYYIFANWIQLEVYLVLPETGGDTYQVEVWSATGRWRDTYCTYHCHWSFTYLLLLLLLQVRLLIYNWLYSILIIFFFYFCNYNLKGY